MKNRQSERYPITRRALLGQLVGGAGVLGAGILWRAASEPFQPVVERIDISLPDLPMAFDGIRIAHLSDLHVQPEFPAERLNPALELVRQERPDLIALTGDYVFDRGDECGKHMLACIAALKKLPSTPLGAFASFGNHDFPPPPADPPAHPWLDANIVPLLDRAVPVRWERETLWIIGLRSGVARPPRPLTTLAQAPASALRLLLWHEPDLAHQGAAAGASLQLSGHTHGGQILLPGIGPLRLPQLGKVYYAGLFWLGGMPLYVTRGVGVLPPRLRLNCPPEVTILTLRRGFPIQSRARQGFSG